MGQSYAILCPGLPLHLLLFRLALVYLLINDPIEEDKTTNSGRLQMALH